MCNVYINNKYIIYIYVYNIILKSIVNLYFRKDYVCHHSSFKKVDKDKNLKKSKNMSCPAKVSIKVKKQLLILSRMINMLR